MMLGKEDLGLSLSLSLGPLHHHFHSIMPKSTSTCTPVEYWPSRPIDVNRAPTTTERDRSELEDEQQAGASSSTSPNTSSTVSNSAGSGGKRDRASAMMDIRENETERGIMSDVEEVDADGSRKKLRLSKDQSVLLEESFKEHNTLNQKQKVALAKQLKLRARQVEVWFQNRRARTKLKQTEVDCEFLKRCCESLTEENRRLHKEVQELRKLKIMSPHHLYIPPTTLTMCPSCQRITSPHPTHHHHHRPMPPQPPLALDASGMPSFPRRS